MIGLSDEDSDFPANKPPSYNRSLSRKMDSDSDSSDSNKITRLTARSAQDRSSKTLNSNASSFRATSKSAGI